MLIYGSVSGKFRNEISSCAAMLRDQDPSASAEDIGLDSLIIIGYLRNSISFLLLLFTVWLYF